MSSCSVACSSLIRVFIPYLRQRGNLESLLKSLAKIHLLLCFFSCCSCSSSSISSVSNVSSHRHYASLEPSRNMINFNLSRQKDWYRSATKKAQPLIHNEFSPWKSTFDCSGWPSILIFAYNYQHKEYISFALPGSLLYNMQTKINTLARQDYQQSSIWLDCAPRD